MPILSLPSKAVVTSVCTSDLYGPFEPYGNDVKLSFQVSLGIEKDTDEEFEIHSGFDRHYITTIEPTVKRWDGSILKYEYIIPNSKYFTEYGYVIHFYAYFTSDGEEFLKKNFYINPLANKSINAKDYENTFYLIERTMFSFDSRFYTNEMFDFRNTSFYFKNETYNVLPLDGLSFRYKGPYPFYSYESASLVINDPEHLFPAISHDNEENVYIPLLLNYDGENVTFSYKNRMYMEESLRLMSLERKTGYKYTPNFYMPRNKIDKANTLTFAINIHEMGRNKTNITIPLEYYPGINELGKCRTSKYCVYGGIYD